MFLAHKALWLGVLKDLEASGESFLDGLDGSLLKGFSLKFHFSFLQRPGAQLQICRPAHQGRHPFSHKTGMEIWNGFC